MFKIVLILLSVLETSMQITKYDQLSRPVSITLENFSVYWTGRKIYPTLVEITLSNVKSDDYFARTTFPFVQSLTSSYNISTTLSTQSLPEQLTLTIRYLSAIANTNSKLVLMETADDYHTEHLPWRTSLNKSTRKHVQEGHLSISCFEKCPAGKLSLLEILIVQLVLASEHLVYPVLILSTASIILSLIILTAKQLNGAYDVFLI